MKKLFSILLLTGWVLAQSSCKKFLNEKSQTDLTPVTTEDYSQLLFGTGYAKYSTALAPEVQFLDDDVQGYWSTLVSDVRSSQYPLPLYSWQPDWYQQLSANGYAITLGGLDSYQKLYSLITGANIAITNAQGSVGPQADRNYVQGQGYALRALYYWLLVNLYARPYNDSTTTPDKSPGVPLMLTPALSEKFPVRQSVAEVYKRITIDLDSAASLLDPDQRNSDIYRMNDLAVHLLASRVYLFMEDWPNVIKHASYVVTHHPQLMDLNTWASKGWQPGTVTVPVIGNGNEETLFTFGSLSDYAQLNMSVCYTLSNDLVNSFLANDLRGQIWFYAVPAWFLQYFPVLPYADSKRTYGGIEKTITGSAMRSAEAYLNRAEAFAQQAIKTGDGSAVQSALADLNALRIRRYDTTGLQLLGTMPSDSLLQYCRAERRREFCNEMQRWFDLRRYGMHSITHYYTDNTHTVKYVLQHHDPAYVLPMPPSALSANPNLTDNPQGPVRQPTN